MWQTAFLAQLTWQGSLLLYGSSKIAWFNEKILHKLGCLIHFFPKLTVLTSLREKWTSPHSELELFHNQKFCHLFLDYHFLKLFLGKLFVTVLLHQFDPGSDCCAKTATEQHSAADLTNSEYIWRSFFFERPANLIWVNIGMTVYVCLIN